MDELQRKLLLRLSGKGFKHIDRQLERELAGPSMEVPGVSVEPTPNVKNSEYNYISNMVNSPTLLDGQPLESNNNNNNVNISISLPPATTATPATDNAIKRVTFRCSDSFYQKLLQQKYLKCKSISTIIKEAFLFYSDWEIQVNELKLKQINEQARYGVPINDSLKS